VKHTKGAAVDISLTGDGQLKGISAAGTGTKKELTYVALQVVIDKMNNLFGAESFTESQVREFVQGLVQRLLAYPDLVKQTQVNSKKQFLESQDFQAAVTEAVVDNQGAHNTMADYFFSDGPGISGVIIALAEPSTRRQSTSPRRPERSRSEGSAASRSDTARSTGPQIEDRLADRGAAHAIASRFGHRGRDGRGGGSGWGTGAASDGQRVRWPALMTETIRLENWDPGDVVAIVEEPECFRVRERSLRRQYIVEVAVVAAEVAAAANGL
jgi:hypothetical protein